MKETLLDQAMGLSAGTFASITGLRLYAELDAVRESFIAHCKTLSPSMAWSEAWENYQGGRA